MKHWRALPRRRGPSLARCKPTPVGCGFRLQLGLDGRYTAVPGLVPGLAR